MFNYCWLTEHSPLRSVTRFSSGDMQGSMQGWLLGPQLFILYTSHIPRPTSTKLAVYVDDTSARSDTFVGFKLHRSIVEICGGRPSAVLEEAEATPTRIFIGGIKMPWGSQVKYPGDSSSSMSIKLLTYRTFLRTKLSPMVLYPGPAPAKHG